MRNVRRYVTYTHKTISREGLTTPYIYSFSYSYYCNKLSPLRLIINRTILRGIIVRRRRVDCDVAKLVSWYYSLRVSSSLPHLLLSPLPLSPFHLLPLIFPKSFTHPSLPFFLLILFLLLCPLLLLHSPFTGWLVWDNFTTWQHVWNMNTCYPCFNQLELLISNILKLIQDDV